MALQTFNLYSVKEKKDGKTYFPTVGIAWLGEKEDGTPKLTIQLNMFPNISYHGSIKEDKQDTHKEPNW
jgi:hypothetical protein